MPQSSRGVLKSAESTASSCFPSTSSSVVHPSTSETSHSSFEDKPVKSLSSNVISSGENGSNEIFSLSDQQLSEKMKFIQEIGFGNWGSVWLCEPRLAEDRAVFGERVAVKLVHRSKTPTTAARVRSLWNEMKIVRALRREATEQVVGVGHPSVVQFFSFVITPSYALITMQYLPTPVPVEVPEFRAKPWFAALTDAVAFLHQRGVVHNDIKPANILLTGASPPTPVLVDFGFAEHYTLTSRHAFQSNLAYGTPEYLAPERARGQPHDTRKADVYALGITFFEILVGRTPFEEVEGESFVSKEDLERYWARTVKGKWVGKWEGIMSKQCEKALKRMTVPNADLRVMAADVLNDPYFTGDDETNYSLSVDLSALTEMIPPWSRPVLAASKNRTNSSTKDTKTAAAKAPRSIRAAASATKDKENAPPVKSDTVKSRTSTLHRTSKSITEAFRKSVGVSRRAPKPAVADVFSEEVPKKVEPAIAPKVKSSNTVLRVKNSAAVSKDKSALREKKAVAPVLKERSAVVIAPTPKKELVQDKENAKPKSQGRTLSMGLSFSRSFGRKKAKEQGQEQQPEALEASVDRRESMYFTRASSAVGTPISRSGVSRTPSASKDQSKARAVASRTASPATAPAPAPAPAKAHARSASNPRDVRVIFSIGDAPAVPDASKISETVSGYAVDTPAAGQSAMSFPANSQMLGKEYNSQNTSSVRNRKSLFTQTHDIAQPERIHPSENEEAATTKKPNTLCEVGAPKLSTITQSAMTASPSHNANSTINTTISSPATPNKTRVSKIAAKENRRTTVVAKPARGTPVKTRSSPSRVRASPAKPRGTNIPVFAIPKTSGGTTPRSATKGRSTKVLGDATNTAGSMRVKKSSLISKGLKKDKAKTEETHDEGDDTITLPIDVFQNATLPRAPKGSSKSIIKHGFRQSIDKAIRFGRTSVSATESTHYPASESTQHRRSLSVGEAWNDDAVNRIITSSMPVVRHALQNEQMGPDGQVDRMAIWIRNVEKVVEEARQSFQVESASPLPLPPPPPRLNHSQSAGLTRISTSAKDPTIRTLTSHANPSVTTFACAPQAPNRSRRATVGSSSSPGINASFTISTQPKPQGGLSRPITPCLNAELGKVEPTSPTPPRLSEVFDSDSRKLILAPVGMAETHTYSIDFERSPSAAAMRPKSQQSSRLFRTPSPTINEPTSPTTASRPATSMSMRTKNMSQAENDYDRYLMTQTNVVRKGKGYQSDFTIRGKGIENIPIGQCETTGATYKRNSMFNRFKSPSNTVSERTGTASRVANAFRTIVAGGAKKREGVDAPVVVGGGFGQRINYSRKAQTWSRAQAV